MAYLNLKDYKPSEKEITREIRGYLKARGVWHWKNWGGPMGEPGVSDILGSYKGKPLAIEVKTEKGKLSNLQILFLERAKKEGWIAFVAPTVEDVEEALNAATLRS